jgi:hypothetical protein
MRCCAQEGQARTSNPVWRSIDEILDRAGSRSPDVRDTRSGRYSRWAIGKPVGAAVVQQAVAASAAPFSPPPPRRPGSVSVSERSFRFWPRQSRSVRTRSIATFRMADPTHQRHQQPNRKQWAKDVIKKDSDEVLAGKVAFTARSSCGPAGVPGFVRTAPSRAAWPTR